MNQSMLKTSTDSNTAELVASPNSIPPVTMARRPLGLLSPTVILAVYWIATETSYQIELGMFYRFVTRMVVLLVTLLFFLGWGFSRRHFTFGQRLLAFGLIMGTALVAGALSHPKTGIFATLMMGLPITLTLSIGWLWLTRRRSAQWELTGIGLSALFVFSVSVLLRWDGMDGRQRPELSWRWRPSSEERFLQQSEPQTRTVVAAERPPLVETADDWTSFRGGNREGVVRGIKLTDWSQAPPSEAWRRRVGPAWSSVIAIGDFLFTQEQRGDREAVVCYQAASGKEVWVHHTGSAPDRFNDSLSGPGPRGTPTFHDNRIYSYGAKGQFESLNAATGEAIWTHALFAMTGAAVPQWGASTSPTIVDDKVVVFTGGQQENSLLAFDRLTGEKLWQAPGGKVSYCTPQVMTIAGERLIVMHDDEGLNGVSIVDGKVLWKHPSPNAGTFQPMLQPHQIADDRLIINWDAGLLCLQIQRQEDKWKLTEIWTSNRLKPSFNDFVIHEDHIYGLDDGIFCCVDVKQGKRLWKKGRYGFGQILLLPDLSEILVVSEQGDVIRVAADPKTHRELGQFKAVEGKTWNHPLLAHGRLVVRNSEEMACFQLQVPATVARIVDPR